MGINPPFNRDDNPAHFLVDAYYKQWIEVQENAKITRLGIEFQLFPGSMPYAYPDSTFLAIWRYAAPTSLRSLTLHLSAKIYPPQLQLSYEANAKDCLPHYEASLSFIWYQTIVPQRHWSSFSATVKSLDTMVLYKSHYYYYHYTFWWSRYV